MNQTSSPSTCRYSKWLLFMLVYHKNLSLGGPWEIHFFRCLICTCLASFSWYEVCKPAFSLELAWMLLGGSLPRAPFTHFLLKRPPILVWNAREGSLRGEARKRPFGAVCFGFMTNSLYYAFFLGRSSTSKAILLFIFLSSSPDTSSFLREFPNRKRGLRARLRSTKYAHKTNNLSYLSPLSSGTGNCSCDPFRILTPPCYFRGHTTKGPITITKNININYQNPVFYLQKLAWSSPLVYSVIYFLSSFFVFW